MHNKIKILKIHKKDFKITFILSLVIIVFQILSFKFIYPSLYLNLNFDFSNIILNLVLLQGLNCIVEELFFRGYVLGLLTNIYNNKERLIISIIIFVIYHIVIFDITSIKELVMLILFTSSAGLCLGYIYIKTDNLLPCILTHMTYNLSQNIISIEFNTFNLEFQNIYIQFMYPSLIFITVLTVFSIFNQSKLRKIFSRGDDEIRA